MKIKANERDAIIQSLKAGVVPGIGLQYIQVGRNKETTALVRDIDRVCDGGTGFRLVIGEYGSGKTFFLNLIKTIALKKKLVVIQADLSPDKRLHSTGGHARALYTEAITNMSTASKPNGGAVENIVQSFIQICVEESGGKDVEDTIKSKLKSVQDLVDGYDFSQVITMYWKGYNEDNLALQSSAIRWLKGEYSTKTDANKDLGVRSIIEDAKVYDYIKLWSIFSVLSGRGGLLVLFDEMVNLYKLSNTKARNSNYEQLLRIINDTLQGNAKNIAFVMGGTPDFLMDGFRGLYSYEALKSRLEENRFAVDGLVDLDSPVVRLQSLAPEDLFILLQNIRSVFAYGDETKYLVPDECLQKFMEHCHKKIGAEYFKTPRNTIKEFVSLLSVLEQNPEAKWQELLGQINIKHEHILDKDIDDGEEDLASYAL